jgi:hypothetical protein
MVRSGRMKRAPKELPPEVVDGLAAATRAYDAEPNSAMQGQIAVLMLRELEAHWPGKLRLPDVLAAFACMREHMAKTPVAVALAEPAKRRSSRAPKRR